MAKKNANAVALGRKGGLAAAQKLSTEQRKDAARRAAMARWARKPSADKARELLENEAMPAWRLLGELVRSTVRMDQVRGFDYHEWKPSTGISRRPPILSDPEVLANARTDRFFYLPAGLDDLSRLRYRFLCACEELGIPEAKRPKFDPPITIIDPLRFVTDLPRFLPPSFDNLRDSRESWREGADAAWATYCAHCLDKICSHRDELVNCAPPLFCSHPS